MEVEVSEENGVGPSPVAISLRKIIRGEVREAEPLAAHTSFGIGGPALVMVFPLDTADLEWVLKTCHLHGTRVVLLGHGTNVLAPDEGLEAVVIKTTRLDGMETDGLVVRAQAGISLGRVLGYALRAGLSGGEFMAGIPGTVGGAVAMNAGTRLGDMASVVERVLVIAADGEGGLKEIDNVMAGFRYRSSRISDEGMVVAGATMRFLPGAVEDVKRRVEEIVDNRKRTQPLELPSAGSVFKNPAGHSAGQLIEKAGCKGLRRGGACVSSLHANFIVNMGEARAKDILLLVDQVRERVKAYSGITLETEIRMLD
jgi:UDP-N-acetylmuramate dehydrogenase